MEKLRKNIIIAFITAILIIPIFFGFYLELLLIKKFESYNFIIILFGVLILIILGKIIEIYGYDENSIKLMMQHDVVNVLMHKNNKSVLWIFFPLTIIMEELIFRYYLIGFLIFQLKLSNIYAILVSSLIFSLYHIHFWFRFKNKRITFIYISFSFFLGLLIGFVLITLGLIICILIHYFIAFFIYYNIYHRYFKEKR